MLLSSRLMVPAQPNFIQQASNKARIQIHICTKTKSQIPLTSQLGKDRQLIERWAKDWQGTSPNKRYKTGKEHLQWIQHHWLSKKCKVNPQRVLITNERIAEIWKLLLSSGISSSEHKTPFGVNVESVYLWSFLGTHRFKWPGIKGVWILSMASLVIWFGMVWVNLTVFARSKATPVESWFFCFSSQFPLHSLASRRANFTFIAVHLYIKYIYVLSVHINIYIYSFTI